MICIDTSSFNQSLIEAWEQVQAWPYWPYLAGGAAIWFAITIIKWIREDAALVRRHAEMRERMRRYEEPPAMNVIYTRFREDDRPIPEPESRVSFPVPDAMMELEDGVIVGLGSEWRFDCCWTHKRLLIDEIWLRHDIDRHTFTHHCFDLREDAASREIAAALRRYYEDNPRGQRSLRWYAESAEEDAAS